MRPALACLWLLAWSMAAPAWAADVWGVVTAVDDRAVTIELPAGSPAPARNAMVDITTTAFGDELVIGEWRVETVREDGAVVAAPVDVLAAPEPGMRAVIHTLEE